MRLQPTLQRLAQPPLPFPVHQADDALARHEGGLQQLLGAGEGLVGAQSVQIGFRHFGARFGLEQQGVEIVERREWRHGRRV